MPYEFIIEIKKNGKACQPSQTPTKLLLAPGATYNDKHGNILCENKTHDQMQEYSADCKLIGQTPYE